MTRSLSLEEINDARDAEKPKPIVIDRDMHERLLVKFAEANRHKGRAPRGTKKSTPTKRQEEIRDETVAIAKWFGRPFQVIEVAEVLAIRHSTATSRIVNLCEEGLLQRHQLVTRGKATYTLTELGEAHGK